MDKPASAGRVCEHVGREQRPRFDQVLTHRNVRARGNQISGHGDPVTSRISL